MTFAFVFFVVLALTRVGADPSRTLPLEDALAAENECSDSTCSLNALQLRGQKKAAEGVRDMSSLECLWKDADEPWQKRIQQKLALLDFETFTALSEGQAKEMNVPRAPPTTTTTTTTTNTTITTTTTTITTTAPSAPLTSGSLQQS
jgi:hypothetical protein